MSRAVTYNKLSYLYLVAGGAPMFSDEERHHAPSVAHSSSHAGAPHNASFARAHNACSGACALSGISYRAYGTPSCVAQTLAQQHDVGAARCASGIGVWRMAARRLRSARRALMYMGGIFSPASHLLLASQRGRAWQHSGWRYLYGRTSVGKTLSVSALPLSPVMSCPFSYRL